MKVLKVGPYYPYWIYARRFGRLFLAERFLLVLGFFIITSSNNNYISG